MTERYHEIITDKRLSSNVKTIITIRYDCFKLQVTQYCFMYDYDFGLCKLQVTQYCFMYDYDFGLCEVKPTV